MDKNEARNLFKKTIDIEKMSEEVENQTQKNTKRRKYEIIDSGTDAIIHFGKYSGMKVSALSFTDEGYLKWILEQDFEDDLKSVIEEHLTPGRLPSQKSNLDQWNQLNF